MTRFFRKERREIFGEADVDYNTLKSCCQILLDELETLYTRTLGRDYAKFKRALTFYEECLSDADYEQIPDSVSLIIPDWLTVGIAEAL